MRKEDYHEWKLTTIDPQERSAWRSDGKSAMHAASQLPGKGSNDVDVAPAPACLSKIRLCYMMYIVFPLGNRDSYFFRIQTGYIALD